MYTLLSFIYKQLLDCNQGPECVYYPFVINFIMFELLLHVVGKKIVIDNINTQNINNYNQDTTSDNGIWGFVGDIGKSIGFVSSFHDHDQDKEEKKWIDRLNKQMQNVFKLKYELENGKLEMTRRIGQEWIVKYCFDQYVKFVQSIGQTNGINIKMNDKDDNVNVRLVLTKQQWFECIKSCNIININDEIYNNDVYEMKFGKSVNDTSNRDINRQYCANMAFDTGLLRKSLISNSNDNQKNTMMKTRNRYFLYNVAKEYQCQTCSRNTKRLKLCKKCKNVYYCSKLCQKRDWLRHRAECPSSS